MQSRWISCNACGADAFQLLSSAGEWKIGKCKECGLVYLNPAPFFEPTSEFSEMSRGFQYTRYMHEPISPKIFAYEAEQLKTQQQEIARLTGKTLPEVRYLDVGCGFGACVRAATDLGWKATGVDIDPELIREGVQQHGADLRCTPLLEAGFKDQSFNFIRMRDVIEHLPNPYESLLDIHRLLCPGGIALVVAPNEGSLISRMRLLAGMKRTQIAFGDLPHHIHGFTPITLRRILERTHFKILKMTTTVPVDSGYVTSNNMRSANRPLLVSIWKGARMLGMGNFLVAWAEKR